MDIRHYDGSERCHECGCVTKHRYVVMVPNNVAHVGATCKRCGITDVRLMMGVVFTNFLKRVKEV